MNKEEKDMREEYDNYIYCHRKLEKILGLKSITLTIEGKDTVEELYRVLNLIPEEEKYLEKEKYKLLSSRDKFEVLVKGNKIMIYTNGDLLIDKCIDELINSVEPNKDIEIIRRVRGTKDLYGKDYEVTEEIRKRSKVLFDLNGYKAIETPIIEYESLYKDNIGERTDIVTREMYCFKDRGGRYLSLRPEGTLGVLRAVLQNKLHTDKKGVNKYWYMGKMYRYERPQKGRGREFTQLGVECLGSQDIRLDIEVIRLGLNILKQLNIEGLVLEINNIGDFKDRLEYNKQLIRHLDKYKKNFDIHTRATLSKNPLRLLDSKDRYLRSLIKEVPTIENYVNKRSRDRFNKLQETLKDLNIEYRVNPIMVRGIDYYTDTIFEILYKKSTLCGGGRYNNVLKYMGGDDIPGVGWSIGVERVTSLIIDQYKEEEDNTVMILNIGNVRESESLNISQLLTEEGIKNEIDYSEEKLKRKLERLDKTNGNYLILLGEEEIKQGVIKIKSLRRSEQISIKKDRLVEELNKFMR